MGGLRDKTIRHLTACDSLKKLFEVFFFYSKSSRGNGLVLQYSYQMGILHKYNNMSALSDANLLNQIGWMQSALWFHAVVKGSMQRASQNSRPKRQHRRFNFTPYDWKKGEWKRATHLLTWAKSRGGRHADYSQLQTQTAGKRRIWACHFTLCSRSSHLV